MTLSGDPGIGKSRTSQELSAIAEQRGAHVFWGQCYDGEGAPPYWPWIQVLRSYIQVADPRHLEFVMGAGAAHIAAIVPELHSTQTDLGPLPVMEPDQARFQLFDSINSFLRLASSGNPLLLVLEDIHWADASSLLLLEFMAGNMADSRVMIIGTYRDIEVSPEHPLSRTLGSLVRHSGSGGFQRISLGGMSLAEVGEMVVAGMGTEPSQNVVEAVHRRTEGNPLFVGEMVRLIGQGESEGGELLVSTIPEGIRDTIRLRLERLSEECNRVLTVASVIGREFDFDLLARMTDSSDDDLLDVVDEAVEAHVIEDMPGTTERYRFSHALIEQTLYEKQTTSRRARLHSRIGETLEGVYGGDLKAHASELVAHFARSPRRQDSEKALRYGRLAAEQATKQRE